MLVTKNNRVFCPNTTAVADDEVEAWYSDLLKSNYVHILISTQVQLLRLRVGVAEKEITPFELFIDFESFTTCDKNGVLVKYPPQFNVGLSLMAKLAKYRK